MATPSNVKAMFDAYPAQGGNEIGVLARLILVNKVKAVTPGAHTQAWPLESKPPFRDIFFPGYQPRPYEGDIGAVTGINDAWWGGLSTAVLVGAIYNVSSEEHPYVK